VVLGSDLNDHRKILADVSLEHGLETLDGIIDGKRSEIGNQPVRLEMSSVDHGSLDVVKISEMLESPLEKSSLLAELSDRCTVVMSEHLVRQNSISDLGSDHEIHL